MSDKRYRIEVVIYPITGRQGFFNVPHTWCEECDLTIQTLKTVLADLKDDQIGLRVLPWMLYWWKPLWRGGWHAPILTVNGRIITQGVVPSKPQVVQAIRDARGTAREASDEDARSA